MPEEEKCFGDVVQKTLLTRNGEYGTFSRIFVPARRAGDGTGMGLSAFAGRKVGCDGVEVSSRKFRTLATAPARCKGAR